MKNGIDINKTYTKDYILEYFEVISKKVKIDNNIILVAEIENNKLLEIERIDNIFELKHTEWEESIFNQIING